MTRRVTRVRASCRGQQSRGTSAIKRGRIRPPPGAQQTRGKYTSRRAMNIAGRVIIVKATRARTARIRISGPPGALHTSGKHTGRRAIDMANIIMASTTRLSKTFLQPRGLDQPAAVAIMVKAVTLLAEIWQRRSQRRIRGRITLAIRCRKQGSGHTGARTNIGGGIISVPPSGMHSSRKQATRMAKTMPDAIGVDEPAAVASMAEAVTLLAEILQRRMQQRITAKNTSGSLQQRILTTCRGKQTSGTSAEKFIRINAPSGRQKISGHISLHAPVRAQTVLRASRAHQLAAAAIVEILQRFAQQRIRLASFPPRVVVAASPRIPLCRIQISDYPIRHSSA